MHDAAVVDVVVVPTLVRARKRKSSEKSPTAGDKGIKANMARGFHLPVDNTTNAIAHTHQAAAQALGETRKRDAGRGNAKKPLFHFQTQINLRLHNL